MDAVLKKLPIFRWHDASIYGSRIDRIFAAIVDLAPAGATSMLDIGCGDGNLAKLVAGRLGIADLFGVDVLVRPNRVIDVREYDGRHVPFESDRFDLVTINDVLHHAEDPQAVVSEALRVLRPGGALVIKDHFRLGPISNAVLWAMDVVGNYSPGVLVRGKYLSPTEWVDVVSRAGGTVDKLLWPFKVHDLPWRAVTKSEYQFVMRVKKGGAPQGAGGGQ